jgi:hypothetical protein
LDTAVVTSTRPSPLPPLVRHGIVMACPPSRRQVAFVSSPNGWSPWEYIIPALGFQSSATFKLQDLLSSWPAMVPLFLTSSWPAIVPLFLTSSWTDLAPYWERWCTTRLLIAVLDLGSAPSKDTPGCWSLLCHGLLGGLTDGSWWCGVSGAPSHEPPSFPPEPGRCLYHILDPLLPGRHASPPPLPMRPLNQVVWEGGVIKLLISR